MAGTVIVHQTIFKRNSKVLIILFINLKKPFLAGRFLYQHFDIFLLCQILIIKNILDLCTVYFHKDITCLNLKLLSDTSRRHTLHDMQMLFLHLSSPCVPSTAVHAYQSIKFIGLL